MMARQINQKFQGRKDWLMLLMTMQRPMTFLTLNMNKMMKTMQYYMNRRQVYYPVGTIFQPPDSKGTHFMYTNLTKGYVQILQFLDKHNAPK
jgi:hypothetical protein